MRRGLCLTFVNYSEDELEDMPASERKRLIIEGLNSGRRAVEIAIELGVTRQYVHMVRKGFEELGDRYFQQERGRPKAVPITQAHYDALVKLFETKSPEDVGMVGKRFTENQVKQWFLQTFKRTITRHQIRRFCMRAGFRLQPERDDEWVRLSGIDPDKPVPLRKEPELPPAPRKRGRPRKDAPALSEDEDLSQESIEASLRATREEMLRRQATQRAAPQGKHAQQRRSPTTPSKKKKRKKR